MADTKITSLQPPQVVTNPATDVLPIVNIADPLMATSGSTRKITVNQLLGAGGTATLASATISGDLTVDTNVLKVDTTNNVVGIGTATPQQNLHVLGTGTTTIAVERSGATIAGRFEFVSGNSTNLVRCVTAKDLVFEQTTGTEVHRIAANGVATWSNVGGVASTAMTLNSTGLGVGQVPSTSKLEVGITNTSTAGLIEANSLKIENNNATVNNAAGLFLSQTGNAGCGIAGIATSRTGGSRASDLVLYYYNQASSASPIEGLRLNSSGNVGIGVTPSAWGTVYKAVDIGLTSLWAQISAGYGTFVSTNLYFDGTNFKYKSNGAAAYYLQASDSAHSWAIAAGGVPAGTTFTPVTAMKLDASGNLLVGVTSGTYNRIKKDSAADAGNAIFELVGASNATSSIHYSVSSYNANAANAASKFGRDGVTTRSINAGGTVNASGADYAEYMVKCGDFALSKGEIAGIDANGKLTNVFADAISFVVKSTDPSYVGNDKWGVDLEGDALEAARQLVDRIAFAGQVPVNVVGAKAGDYIVPVVDGTGIKGIAVTSPTFEQYQIAVGKVIAIDADGRARIIVKVA
jgi:hypothetical protein